jgi:hypothetical protein
MTHTEALKLALDALGKFSIGFHVDAVQLNDLIATLEAALEQPERAQAMRDAGYTRRPTLREMAEDEQAYAAQARRVEQETHGRMRIDPVTGDVSIGTPAEQPEQEPVAWIHRKHYLLGHAENMPPADKALAQGWTPLYTNPPRREWRGLTEDEILTEAARHLGEMHVENCGLGDIKDFARAIEAALKERNA